MNNKWIKLTMVCLICIGIVAGIVYLIEAIR